MKDGYITGNTALKKRFINDINEAKFTVETRILEILRMSLIMMTAIILTFLLSPLH